MPFKFVPIEARRIDVSEIEDVERERLKITLDRGDVLYFGIDLKNGRPHPRLLLDLSNTIGNGTSANDELRKEFARRFYQTQVFRSKTRRFINWLHKLADPYFHAPFTGWTYKRVLEELEIELPMGNEYRGCKLKEGQPLVLNYGTYFSDPVTEVLWWTWGDVASIESVKLSPISLAPASVS